MGGNGYLLRGSAGLLAFLVLVALGLVVRVVVVTGAVLGGLAALPLALLLVLDPVRLALLERVALLVEVGAEVVDRLGDRLAERLLHRVVPVAPGDLLEALLLLGVKPLDQVLQEVLDALGLDPVEVAARAGVDGRHLVLELPRRQL